MLNGFTYTIAIIRITAVCIALWACSLYVYSPYTQPMSSAISSLGTSYQQNETAITNQNYQNNRFLWIRDKTPIARGPGCGLDYTGPVACALVAAPAVPPLINSSTDTTSDRPKDVCKTTDGAPLANSSASQNKPNALTTADLLKTLDNYTAGLAAVTNAQDRANFDTAAGKLSAAVAGLIQSAGPYGAAAAPIAKASVNIALLARWRRP